MNHWRGCPVPAIYALCLMEPGLASADKVPETCRWRDTPLPRNASGRLMHRLRRTQALPSTGQPTSDPRADAARGQSQGT